MYLMENGGRQSSFKLWWRVFSATLRRWHLLIVSVTSMILFALSNLAMVYMVGPVLTALFQPEKATIASQMSKFATSDMLRAKISAALAPLIYRDTPIATLRHFCILLLVIVLSKNLFRYIQNVTTMYLLQSVTNDFRKQLFAKILNFPLAFFHRTRIGELISRIVSDVQMMQNSVAVTIVDMIRDPLQVAVYYAFLLSIDARMTLLITLVAPIIVAVMSVIGKFLRRYGTRMQERMAELTAIIQESLAGIRVVKVFDAISHELGKFNRVADNYLRSLMKMYRVNRLAGPFNEMVGAAVASALLWYGGRRVLAGTGPSPAEFIQYVITLLLLMEPVKSFVDKVNRVQQGLAAAQRVFEVIDHQPKITVSAGHKPISSLERGIKYENVSFRYEGAEGYAVKNLFLEIPRGHIVALVGHSGAGKSTVADLLARFYDPTEGRILADGVDLREISISHWRRMIGMVTQETILFNDTVLANIAYADPAPDEERVIEAARAANALGFIEKLPHNFHTIIGERGTKLSGGERQRIAIARAIYRNPQILIFDEATSALDSVSEKLVQEAIDNLMSGRTVLVIAHRLSTIVGAHKIVVLDHGVKVAEGTHQQLLETSPIYRELYKMQFEGK